MKNDISTIEDIKLLVNTFYSKVNEDELLSKVFNEQVGVDWEKHLPKMYNFWSTILLETMSYEGQPFPHHMKLGINEKHFERWQALFMQTVKDNFSGATADMAMERAKNIATIFQYKLGLKPTEI